MRNRSASHVVPFFVVRNFLAFGDLGFFPRRASRDFLSVGCDWILDCEMSIFVVSFGIFASVMML